MRKQEEWIDFIEGEDCDVNLSQLGFLLKHSKQDQMVVDNLRRLRSVISQVDIANEIDDKMEDTEFMSDFHNRVMCSITSPEPPPQTRRDELSSLDLGRVLFQVPYKRP